MKKNIFFIGMIVLALVLTTGSFAFTFNNSSATLNGTLSDAPWTTYTASALQPDWNSILPAGGSSSEILVPNGPGDYTTILVQYPNTAGTYHWDKVDDQPSDGDATYVSTQGSGQWQGDAYQLSNLQAGNIKSISNVTIFFTYRAGGSFNVKAMAELTINGSTYSGPTVQTNSQTYVTTSWDNTTNPDTGDPWTVDDVNSLQAGMALQGPTSARPALCTQVYVQVDYEFNAVVQGEVPAGNLFDITPDSQYFGDLLVTLYLTNTASLLKDYEYLNLKINVSHSNETPVQADYKILSVENGVVQFTINGGAAAAYVVKVTGGSYSFISDTPDPAFITPEFYLEVSQR